MKPISVDIRLIAATNRNLKNEMDQGRFRDDLFYRLNVLPVYLPPLRERPEDIALLVEHFVRKYESERAAGSAVTGVSQEVLRLFHRYAWPGNVRELENLVERALILCPGSVIELSDLPKEFIRSVDNTLYLDGIPASAKLADTLIMVEKAMIERALFMADNVQAKAADILGIAKSGLSQKLKKLEMEKGSKG
jgi:two-component system NtrC family response regulator